MSILRRHLADKVTVSRTCDEHGNHPTPFYGWQRTFLENGAAVFDGPRHRHHRPEDAAARRIEAPTDKPRRKDDVRSALMEAHEARKKSWGSRQGTVVPLDTRAWIIDFIRRWSERTAMAAKRLGRWIGLRARKYHARR